MAREMKDSGIEWIGEIPESWECTRLKYLVSYNDDSLGETTDNDYEFDYIDIGSVQYGKGITQFQHMTFKDAPSRARRIVKPDDVILSTVRTYLKAVATVPESTNPLIASTGFIVLRAKDNAIIPRFLNYAVLSEAFISLVEAKSVGISYPAINASVVVDLVIPVPSLSEQMIIARYLDAECNRIDAVIEQTRASIEEYKKLKQAVITQVVTKGIRDDCAWSECSYEWIGSYPSDWSIIRIKWLLNERNERSENGEEEPLSMSQKYGLIPTKEMDIVPNMASSFIGAKLCYKDDLVFNKLKAHLGVFAVSQYEGLVSPDYAVYYASSNVNLKYLEYLFKTPQYIGEFKKKSTGVGAGLTRLYTAGLYSIYCALPPLNEQDAIVDYLNAKTKEIDTLIEKKERLLSELENYKKTIIYEYVTGKKEVPA